MESVEEDIGRRPTPPKQRTRSRPLETALAIDDIATKQALLGAVSAIACNVSRMLRRASLILSYHLHSALESGTPLPSKAVLKNVTFWRQLLLVGCRGDNGKEAKHDDAFIQESWSVLRDKFPPIDRNKHDGQIITHAARTFILFIFYSVHLFYSPVIR